MLLPLILSLLLLPFEKWGIDYVGHVHPTSSYQMAYIILVVDYLTKWIEANAEKLANKKTTTLFLFENVNFQVGVSWVLISDCVIHLLNGLIEKLTMAYDIDHCKTTPYHSQTNRLAKRDHM